MSDATEPSRWATAAVAHVEDRCTGGPIDRSLRITLNFHPDREVSGVPILRAMASDGVYRSQFETGVSNGGLTAFPGGDRWLWEQRLFGGAYDTAPAGERPKYGALNHRGRSLGGAPRFGSAYVRLAENVLERSTFCFPDSVFEPRDFGTAHRFDLIHLAHAFDAVERDDASEAKNGGLLDDYIEAHVHGVVSFATEVEAVVLDSCYRGTDVETAAWDLGVPIEWHEGRVLTVSELELHPDYRGPDIIEVGRRIARDGLIDARTIGDAVRRRAADQQALKMVWHLVARFGASSGWGEVDLA